MYPLANFKLNLKKKTKTETKSQHCLYSVDNHESQVSLFWNSYFWGPTFCAMPIQKAWEGDSTSKCGLSPRFSSISWGREENSPKKLKKKKKKTNVATCKLPCILTHSEKKKWLKIIAHCFSNPNLLPWAPLIDLEDTKNHHINSVWRGVLSPV